MAAESPELLDHMEDTNSKYNNPSTFKHKSSFPFSSDFSDFSSDFPYNPVFDPIKLSAASKPNKIESPKYTNPYEVMYDSLFEKQKNTDS